MKRLSILLFSLVLTAIPSVAFAHATPVEMNPSSGARLEESPAGVSLRFSERLETGSSRIRVTNAQNTPVSVGDAQVSDDGYSLSVPVAAGSGLYTISWSVVSKDDGHFTRGSYAYSVNSNEALPTTREEVVQIATTQEATLMFVEFLGNSILWGCLVIFLLTRDPRMRRIFAVLSLIAAALGAAGAVGQILLKSHQLAGLHSVSAWDAMQLYSHTVAGSSTIVRGIALAVGGVLGGWFGFLSVRTSALVIGVPLIVFAFFRAIVSHASANPFLPELSIAVNFIHVIEKDLWLGVLIVLCVFMGSRIRETVVPRLLPRMLKLLSTNLAILVLTAGYIVWLHLKSFSNVTTTSWGEAFVPLMVSALFLIALHTYHVCMLRVRTHSIKNFLAVTLGAQTAAAALVVFFTSVVIITSPPSHTGLHVLTAHDAGTRVSLSRAPYEDEMALLQIDGADGEPTVFIGSRDGGLRPALEQRFVGGYVFPAALIPERDTTLNITIPRSTGYDAQVSLEVTAADLEIPTGHGRSLDLFTVIMIAIATIGVLLSVVLNYLGRDAVAQIELRTAGSRALVGGIAMSVLLLVCVVGVGRLAANMFEARCVDDGNMWHLMQPTAAGRVLSSEVREGCMWGMGEYAYLFVDSRQYEYLSSFGPAVVTMEAAPKQLRANVPTNLTFKLTNASGSPASLLIEMERYVHVVIVSKDQSVFAHLHPEDARPLTLSEIER